MKSSLSIFAVLFGGLLGWGPARGLSGQTQTTQSAKDRAPVVVELFTSEGCSSCPPADKLLAELDARQPLNAAEIIAIEEHVDYWDQDGWKDPFSSSAWTTRQSEYSGALRNSSNYTPEMVVDGKECFVGSRSGTAVQEIEKSAAIAKTKIELSDVSLPQNRLLSLKINVERPSNGTPKDTSEVILAITESNLYSSVKAGENNGKELHHAPVLRVLKTLGTTGKNGQEGFSAQPSVKLDSAWKVENLRAVIFVQERKSRRILGAAEAHLTPPNAASR